MTAEFTPPTPPKASLVHVHLGADGMLRRWPEMSLAPNLLTGTTDQASDLGSACKTYAAEHGHSPSTLLLNSAAAQLLLTRCVGGAAASSLAMAATLRPFVPVQHVLVGDGPLMAAALTQAVHAHASETLHTLGTTLAGRFNVLDATVSAFQAAARYQEEHPETPLFHWPVLFEVLRHLLPSSSELESAFDDTMSEAARVLAGASLWLSESAVLHSTE